MANEITKVTDQNGVDHPFKDVAALPRSEQAVLGAKNLLRFPYSESSAIPYTRNGIEYSLNRQKVVAQGQATTASWFTLADSTRLSQMLEVGKEYIITGCPSGGGSTTYRLQVAGVGLYDEGNGVRFTYSSSITGLYIQILNGADLTTPVTFEPMIRFATDTDPSYAPYAMTNKQLTEKVQGIINAATNAADFAAFKTAIGNL